MFVEKPLSAKSAEEVQQLSEQLQALQNEHSLVVAVGYMLRYSPAIEVGPDAPYRHETAILYGV